MIRRWAFATLLGLVSAPGVARGQGVIVEVGRLFASPDWTTYRIGLAQPLSGVLGYTLYGTHAGEAATSGSGLWGPGADLTFFRGGHPGPYLAAGVSAGLASGDGNQFWSSWSAGLGYELRSAGPFTLGAEGRWRELQYVHHRSGFEFALRLGVAFGGRRASPPPVRPSAPGSGSGSSAAPPPLRTTVERSGISSDRVELISSVLGTALDAMGTPYKWGGTGEADGGFDCSGLIQYAYAQHGITLPRRSADQALQGAKVDKRPEALLPGDILTFSNGGGRITHVGLYLGDGKFIHSANDGVQVSLLNSEDVYGRWWWRRWVGARRIVS
jgi:cell wall-associated NlpC family hydrolase